MSAFYDRTTGNITGISPLVSLPTDPAYGSRVSFNSRANIYDSQNGYFFGITMSVNSLDAKFVL